MTFSDTPLRELGGDSIPLDMTHAGPRTRVHLQEVSRNLEEPAASTPNISIPHAYFIRTRYTGNDFLCSYYPPGAIFSVD